MLFHEPRAFCLASTATRDTLFLHNMGDSTITWSPVSAPVGSTNLNTSFQILKGTIVALVWTWNPPVLPAVDSLVVSTNDPDFLRLVVPFRKEAPGTVDVDPPGKPVLALPLDGATLLVGSTTEILWTRVSDCSGIASYQFQIALDANFTQVVFDSPVGVTSTRLITEEADRGKAYWRVRARDASPSGLPGPWSDTRTWTVP